MNVIRNLVIDSEGIFIGIHYVYIYAKQRSKWNSGKINYNYLFE